MREAGELGQKRFKDAMQLAWKMEEDTIDKGIQKAPRSWKNLHSSLQGKCSLVTHLNFSPTE